MAYELAKALYETIAIDNGHPLIRYQEACYARLLELCGTDAEKITAGEIIEELELNPFIQQIPQFWIDANLQRV